MKKQKIVSNQSFFNAYRKRGFGITLNILNSVTDKELKESTFFDLLENNGSYLNEFYRVKKSLVDAGLIAYHLDESYEKVIFITPKGMDFVERIGDLERKFTEK